MDADSPQTPLGRLVLARRLLTEEQLEVALAEHLSSGRRLGQVLVERGYVTVEQLAELLAQQSNTHGLLKTRVAEAEAGLDAQPLPEPEPQPQPEAHPGHVLFVWNPSGYALLSRSGEPPAVGSEVGVSGGSRVVTKIGPSPLPGDRRPCAYLDAP